MRGTDTTKPETCMHPLELTALECPNAAVWVLQAYADENSLFFWETSAKTNVNVAEVFHDIAERLPRASAAPQPPVGGITLTETVPERAKKSACCS